MFNEDLVKEYGAAGIPACPMLREGQVFYADYAKPDGFCDEGLEAISNMYLRWPTAQRKNRSTTAIG